MDNINIQARDAADPSSIVRRNKILLILFSTDCSQVYKMSEYSFVEILSSRE